MSSHGSKGGSHFDTTKRLGDVLDHATAEFMRVQRIASEVVKDALCGMPLSDGQLQIVQAAGKVKTAFRRYQGAVKRYRDFVDNGIVPSPASEEEEPER